MTTRRSKVFVTRKLPDAVEARMRELFDVTLNADDHPMTQGELAAAMAECEVLVPTVTDDLNADLIGRAGAQLKLIANYGAGFDHIRLHACEDKGILVTNTPGALTEDTADMTMALILAVPRRLGEGQRLLRAQAWTGWSPSFHLGHRIGGKKLGIIGMGRIGRAVADRARAFGLDVHYHNRTQLAPDLEAAHGATYWADLDAMLAAVDIVSVNAPKTRHTHHLLNRARLERLQPHAYVVNTARGSLIDEDALIDLIQRGKIAGAGLDVFENEPDIDPRFYDLPRVELLPHMGSATFEGREAMGNQVIVNIKTWIDGHRPPDRVYRELV